MMNPPEFIFDNDTSILLFFTSLLSAAQRRAASTGIGQKLKALQETAIAKGAGGPRDAPRANSPPTSC
jgi:hypothetical protein